MHHYVSPASLFSLLQWKVLNHGMSYQECIEWTKGPKRDMPRYIISHRSDSNTYVHRRLAAAIASGRITAVCRTAITGIVGKEVERFEVDQAAV